MNQIISVQQCKAVGDYVPIQIPSHSDPSRSYAVLVTDRNDPSQSICECDGYQYRGHCTHQREAADLLCDWTQLSGVSQQTDEQKHMMICPRCGGPTEWVMELVDE